MEKQMTLEANALTTKGFATQVKRAAYRLAAPQRWLRKYYSYVLGHNVGKAQARMMTEAQLAFFAVTLPADYPLMLRMAVCAWFVVTVRKVRTKYPPQPSRREGA